MPQKVTDALLQRVRVEGERPYSLEDIRGIMLDMLNSPTSPLASINSAIQHIRSHYENAGIAVNSNDDSQGVVVYGRSPSTLHKWSTDEKFHHVPEGWKWPSYTIHGMWSLWHFGDLPNNFGPYKHISRNHDLTNSTCQQNYCRAKRVMNELVRICIAANKINSIKDITLSNSQELIDYANMFLIQRLYVEYNHPRPNDLNINTVANRMFNVGYILT